MTTDSAEAIPCRKCGAETGQPCQTPTGRHAEAHLPRRRAYRRRMEAAGGGLPDMSNPIIAAALAERQARTELDRG